MQTKLRTVLIPLDGSAFSRQVLPVVRRTFRPDECILQLLRVAVGPEETNAGSPRFVPAGQAVMPGQPADSGIERATEPASRGLDEAALQRFLEDELQADLYYLQAAGFEVTTQIRFGDPAQEIVGHAQQAHADYVAMATHGRTGVQRLVLGSVAAKVVHDIGIPVLLIRPVPAAEERPA